ncbi:MAG TPA: hypothetical protein VJI96_04325 [Candidatus Andersenbacteria bacterium]|nr:hypothetical protein [Candidatus Andersenbacteria bacterium]
MDSAESFAIEWNRLQEKRQQLASEADQLKRKSNSLTEDPTMKQLLKEKSNLKKGIPQLNMEVKVHKVTIEGNYLALEKLRRAATDETLQQEYAIRLKNRRDRLIRLQENNAPATIVENEKRMIFEIEGPIDQVEELYQQMNAVEEQKQLAAQRELEETLERIWSIEEHYLQTKNCLEVAIRDLEQKRIGCRAEEIEWATQTRSHLDWMLEHEPSYKDDVIRRYRARFPSDNLPIIVSRSTSTPVQVQNRPKIRQKRNGLPISAPPEVASPIVKTWRLFVTFNAGEQGTELPQEQKLFLSSLQSILHRAAYHNLDVRLAHNKLMVVTRMTTQQRQKMQRVVEAELPGWKILRLGKKHLLFLLIDESERHIRFLPCPRKNSHSHY